MRISLARPARVPMWLAGVAACLILVPGMIAIAPPIPALYASILGDRAPAEPNPAPDGSDDVLASNAQAYSTSAPAATTRRGRGGCPDCGVVETIRQGGRSGSIGGRSGAGYEVTVRFRDGRTIVLNETSPRSWQAGSRVIVIGRAETAEE